MIGYLTGNIISIKNDHLLLDVNRVGYIVFTTPGTLSQVQVKDQISLFIYTHVKEDVLDLFGFRTEEDLILFKLLNSVSGIGPKTAILIVDRGAINIQRAISTADVDFFTGIPRLGRKNSQKIIIELRNKLEIINELDLTGELTGETSEIIDALMNMGFNKPDIKKALSKINEPNLSITDKIKKTLRLLNK